MLAITPFSTGYKVLGVAHILCVVAAFGPVLVYPSLRKTGDVARLARLHMRMTMPAMLLVWVFGMGLAGMSKSPGADDPLYHLSQTWLWTAVVVWLIVMLAGWFLIKPSITDNNERADKRFSAGVGITHLGLVVALVLMVWKPGA